MNGAERGWLLLCADLGDGLTPLSLPQVRGLQRAVRGSETPEDLERDLTAADLRAMGCADKDANRILRLLDRERALDTYLALGAERGIRPITRSSPDYPSKLRRLGDLAPAVLFFRGDPVCLSGPFVSVVGSRVLTPAAERFAGSVGAFAAAEGRVLVSGNAVGADQTAQAACLKKGGRVLSFLPDSPADHTPGRGEACLCEQGWHLSFTACRALRRNLFIHAMGEVTLAVQTGTAGGTWSGCVENLKRRLSPLYVRRDGSAGAEALIARGARPLERLTDLCAPSAETVPLFP